MLTAAQLEANRRNAQSSTGPRSDEGKRVASLNARRHNLTGQVSAMTDEDRAAHDAFSAAMLKDLAPEGAIETQLAQRIATDSWRLNRISATEDNLFALGLSERGADVEADRPEIHAAFAAARTFEAQARQLQLLSLYEQRLNRAVRQNLALLRELQAERKAERQRALDEAKKLYRLSERKGVPHQPEGNGFVFSNEEIRAAVEHERRLRQAEFLEIRHRKHENQHAQAA